MKDKYGFTVLHHAVYRDNTKVVTTLLKEAHIKHEVCLIKTKSNYNVPDIKEPDEQGNTALHLAALGKNAEMIKVLMVEISVKRVNKEGMTPLHIAAGTGVIEGIRAILEHEGSQAIINTEDISGRTPLLLASSSGNKEVVTLLLRKGASMQIKNKHRESPLHFCARFGHAGVMKLLTQKLEQEKGIFREPVKKPKSFPVWMRGNTTRPLERLISKGGTKVRCLVPCYTNISPQNVLVDYR